MFLRILIEEIEETIEQFSLTETSAWASKWYVYPYTQSIIHTQVEKNNVSAHPCIVLLCAVWVCFFGDDHPLGWEQTLLKRFPLKQELEVADVAE
ncbi:hypothetical protein LR48_Vigan05g217600 [Vigna angularis]|uniref:Uncharacterized protein n=1 Tax=Phaseolus angularis TaxID=3914 RepID=A0A0L9UPD9_PHAAN|nr:hypothetical protein LR48_Vigan05g217600 [Vigna angularis]